MSGTVGLAEQLVSELVDSVRDSGGSNGELRAWRSYDQLGS